MRVPWRGATLPTDCGPACLAMVLSHHGRDSSVEEIRERLGTGRDGTTGLDLVRVGRELGLSTRGVRMTDRGLLASLGLPAVAHYKVGHFVVLERVRQDSVRVLDPLRGRVTIPTAEFLSEMSGVLLLSSPGPDFRRSRDRSWLRFLREAVRGRLRAVGGLLALSVVVQSFAFVLPAAVAYIVDSIVPGTSPPALGLVLVGVPILAGAYALSSWMRGAMMASFAGRASEEWLDRVFLKLVRLPLAFFHGRPTEEVLLRVQGADAVLDDLLDQTAAAVLDVMLALSALLVLWIRYPGPAAIVMAAGALQACLTWLAQRESVDYFVRDMLAHTRLYSFLAEALAGIADLKMVGVERVAPKWTRLLKERIDAGLVRKRHGALWDGLLAAAQMTAPLLVLAAGAAMAVRGAVSVGAVVGFYSLSGVVLAPVSRLAGSAYRVRSTTEYLRRAYDVLGARAEADRRPAYAADARDLRGRLTLDGVSFRYATGGQDVLADLHLDIAPGETIVVVGRTGSGKSTLARLLATLHEPTTGGYLIDGLPIDRYDLAELRARIGCVFQENVLLGGTILDSVTFGREIPSARLHRALAVACVLEDVRKMPLGLATPVGSGGLHLSGGQRQRLCLARAVAARPSVLILDEATSAVDRLTERRIYRRLARIESAKIVVTHRLYVARYADRVVVLEGGRIAEIGPHQELIASGGPYAALWKKEEDEVLLSRTRRDGPGTPA